MTPPKTHPPNNEMGSSTRVPFGRNETPFFGEMIRWSAEAFEEPGRLAGLWGISRAVFDSKQVYLESCLICETQLQALSALLLRVFRFHIPTRHGNGVNLLAGVAQEP